MDKVIVTVMLIISGIVASFAVFNGVYPAIERSGAAITSASDTLNNRIKSDIQIIEVNESGTLVNAWVKNIGSLEIVNIENSDVFFGPEDNFSRIVYGDISTPMPYWTYQMEGSASEWTPTETNKIIIHLASILSPDVYVFKIIIPNGIFDETFFGAE
ncbi:MAG: hypothetical protein JW967_11640 [Dehalococcoidales bacterium]|nr:hypothetical protein [Dehalococcoidales bacterium]